MIWDKKKLAKMECIWKYIHIIKIFARLLTHFGNFVFWFFVTLVVTSHSAYVATVTKSDGVKIDGLLPPNFL